MKKQQQNGWVAVVLFLTGVFLCYRLSLVGPNKGGFLLLGTHDTLWHLSLTAEIARWGIPPQFPGMSGFPLKNYNYLGDFVSGLLTKASGLPPWQGYCRLGNWLTMAIFVFLTYFVARKIGRSWWAGIFAVLLTVFGGTAAFLQKNRQTDAFMLSSLDSQTTNLHAILGYIILLASLYGYFLFLTKQKIKSGLVAGLFLGLLFGIKSLYFLPFLLACGLIALIRLFQKDSRLFFPLTIGLVTSFILFWFLVKPAGPPNGPPTGGPPAGGFPFQFRPFWLLEKMIEDPDRFYWPDRVLRDQHYQTTGNYFRLAISLIQKLFLYLVGNLWLRLIAFFWLIQKIRKSREGVFYQLAFLTIVFSLLLPLLIVPNPDHYNAVQIGRVAMFLSAFFLGIALKEKRFTFLLVFLFLIPTTFRPQDQPLFISPQEYEALQFLKQKSQPQTVIMDLVPEHEYYLVIPALAERRTYFSDTKTADLVGIDYHQRLDSQRKLAEGKLDSQTARQLFEENQISYVYALTGLFSQEQEKNYQLKAVFYNQTITIYSLT